MAASSAASSISSLVMQLQHIESTIAGICLEVGLSHSLSVCLLLRVCVCLSTPESVGLSVCVWVFLSVFV